MKARITIVLATSFLLLTTMHAQQTKIETMVHNGVSREYIVYIPAIYDGTQPVPLMFNFHGYNGFANGHMNNTAMRPVADTAGFILVYPEGSLFSGNTHWNVGSWTQGSMADDLGFTEAMIDALAAQYNIDQQRVYTCGYSNGGYFSFVLACQLSHRIAAIGSVGGKMSSETFNACNPMHPIPVVTIHGTADNVVSYEEPTPAGSKTVREVHNYWIRFNNTDTEASVSDIPNLNTSDGSTVEYYTYNQGDNCTSVEHYKVIGGGHDWPGVSGNKDIHASSVIWNFVSKYNIDGLIGCITTSSPELVTENIGILVYPNPMTELVNIEMDLSKDVVCHIYSMKGELHITRRIGPGNQTIDVSELPAGVYVLDIGNKAMKLIKSEY